MYFHPLRVASFYVWPLKPSHQDLLCNFQYPFFINSPQNFAQAFWFHSTMYIIGRIPCKNQQCSQWADFHCGLCSSFWCSKHRPPTNTCLCSGRWINVYPPHGPLRNNEITSRRYQLVLGEHWLAVVNSDKADLFFQTTLCHCCNEVYGNLRGFFQHHSDHGDDF